MSRRAILVHKTSSEFKEAAKGLATGRSSLWHVLNWETEQQSSEGWSWPHSASLSRVSHRQQARCLCLFFKGCLGTSWGAYFKMQIPRSHPSLASLPCQVWCGGQEFTFSTDVLGPPAQVALSCILRSTEQG